MTKEFSTSKSLAAGEQGSVLFSGEMIPDGYSAIAAWCDAKHASTLCGCPIIAKNETYVPYIAKSVMESEEFSLYITLQRIS